MREEKIIRVKAIFEFYKESNRAHQPIPCGKGNYRPGHHFSWSTINESYMGAVFFPDELDYLYPGSSAEVEINLWADQKLRSELRPGLKWEIKEAQYIVGSAQLVEVLGEQH